MPSPNLLPSLAHAVSGSAGTAISTIATYPLDLVNTRLKVQRQLLRSSKSETDSYHGVTDAFRRIYRSEGGIKAFFTGLQADVAKSVVDSFLFFLFYNWIRARRLGNGSKRRRELNAVEELAIGAVAGACARLFTTPVGNVVTRRQTENLVRVDPDAMSAYDQVRAAGDWHAKKSFYDVLADIREEKGILGLWAGYSATLVLTLNPSITFFLQQTLMKRVVEREKWESGEGAAPVVTFLMAALSKAVATAVTYPFQIARAREQVSAPTTRKGKEKAVAEPQYRLSDQTERLAARARSSRHKSSSTETIFGTVARIGREEGVGALYDGLWGELLKAFFSHGITMASKDAIHKLLFRLYFAILAYFRRHPQTRARLERAAANVSESFSFKKVSEKSSQMWKDRKKTAQSAVNSSESAVSNALNTGEKVLSNILEEGQRKIGEVTSK